jgi:hypothetical protein
MNKLLAIAGLTLALNAPGQSTNTWVSIPFGHADVLEMWWTNATPPVTVSNWEGWQAVNYNFHQIWNAWSNQTPQFARTNIWTGQQQFMGKVYLGDGIYGDGAGLTNIGGVSSVCQTQWPASAITNAPWLTSSHTLTPTNAGDVNVLVTDSAGQPVLVWDDGYGAYELSFTTLLRGDGWGLTNLNVPTQWPWSAITNAPDLSGYLYDQYIGATLEDTLLTGGTRMAGGAQFYNLSTAPTLLALQFFTGSTEAWMYYQSVSNKFIFTAPLYGDGSGLTNVHAEIADTLTVNAWVTNLNVAQILAVAVTHPSGMGTVGGYFEPATNGDLLISADGSLLFGSAMIGNGAGLTNLTPLAFPTTNSPSPGNALRWNGTNFYWGS